MAIECASCDFPWSRGNFADSMAEGYRCQGLFLRRQTDIQPVLAGYSIVMRGVDEAHLLNIARWRLSFAGKKWRFYSCSSSVPGRVCKAWIING